MKLFRVKVRFDTVIAAMSEAEALRQVQYGMGDIDDQPVTAMATPILTPDDLPNKWGVQCLPWGDHPHRMTIDEILTTNQPKERE